MTSIYTNVLSDKEINYLNNLAEVLAAKISLDSKSSGMVYFSVPITDSIRATLQSRFGLDLSTRTSIPMRWIKGDTVPHIDTVASTFKGASSHRGASTFQNTYLLYLNDSPGHLIVDSNSYPIKANSGFVFNEGLPHETQSTENIPRLLLGPMNEFAEPVGLSAGIYYYSTQAAAIAAIGLGLGYGGYPVYTVGTGGPFGGFTSWRIASSSNGSSSKAVVYNNTDVLNSDDNTAYYYLYPAGPSAPCFLEGSKILCLVNNKDVYVPIEDIRKGMLVKTNYHNNYKPVELIGYSTVINNSDSPVLYKCKRENYHELNDDLIITEYHAILVNHLTETQRKNTIKKLGNIYKTQNKFRLIASVDDRAEPWTKSGKNTVWHLALQNDNIYNNYGIYANGGLLVESISIRYLKEKSNMTLV